MRLTASIGLLFAVWFVSACSFGHLSRNQAEKQIRDAVNSPEFVTLSVASRCFSNPRGTFRKAEDYLRLVHEDPNTAGEGYFRQGYLIDTAREISWEMLQANQLPSYCRYDISASSQDDLQYTAYYIHDIAVTPKGIEAGIKQRNGRFYVQGSHRVFVAVTGIVENGPTADVDFDWKRVAEPNLERLKISVFEGTRQGVAHYKKYDDGWRLTLINGL